MMTEKNMIPTVRSIMQGVRLYPSCGAYLKAHCRDYMRRHGNTEAGFLWFRDLCNAALAIYIGPDVSDMFATDVVASVFWDAEVMTA